MLYHFHVSLFHNVIIICNVISAAKLGRRSRKMRDIIRSIEDTQTEQALHGLLSLNADNNTIISEATSGVSLIFFYLRICLCVSVFYLYADECVCLYKFVNLNYKQKCYKLSSEV